MMTARPDPRVWILLLAAALGLPFAALARYEAKPPWNLFSRQKDLEIGKEAAAQTDKQLPLLPESNPITKYIQAVGNNLAAHTPEPRYPYRFRVVNQKEINAFALPGGPIYINLGTIQAADNEAQIAGVMAHEMGHVLMRHGTAAASKQLLAQLPLQAAAGLLGEGVGADLARLGISFGVGSIFLKYSRSAESQADLVGTDLMYDSGYDPHALPEFFLKLEKESQKEGVGGIPQFLSDHPNPGNRAEAVSQEVATLPPRSFHPESAEFARVKSEAAGMKAMTAKEIEAWQKKQAGVVVEASRADVMPSGKFKALRHAAFSMDYPDNWEVFGDESSAVTIAPRAGLSQEAVAYGVIVNGLEPESGTSATLDDATHQLLQKLREANPDMRTVGEDDLRVAGLRGKSVDLIGSSPVQDQDGHPLRERDWLVTMLRNDGTLIYLLFVSPDRDFAQLRPAFDRMEQSFELR